MEFELTPLLSQTIHQIFETTGSAPDNVQELRCYLRSDARTITLPHVQLLSQALRACETLEDAGIGTQGPVWVHQLLQGAAPVMPVFARERTPHPSLAPRLEKLRAINQNREYAAMIGDLSAHDNPGRDGAEMNTYRSQIAVGLNLIVSMATMFSVGYFVGGTEVEPHGVRAVLCGLTCAIVTMAIEIALFLIGATRIDAKVHKRAQKALGMHDLTRIRENYPDDVARHSRRKVQS